MPELDLVKITGLDPNLLIVLISFPVVATLAGIARHVIGIKSLSVYAPIILTYSFFALSMSTRDHQQNTMLGLFYGLCFVFIVIVSALLASQLLKYNRMHYFPKISLVLSVSSITVLLALVLLRKVITPDIVQTNILALVLIASIAEQFTATMFKKKAKIALVLTMETLITSIFAYFLISWSGFQDVLLKYPYFVLLSFVLNVLVGKYRGLRLFEFIRFRDVLDIPEPVNE